jgi:hypothetical protein
MNLLNFYTKLYGRLKNYGMPVRVMSPIRWAVRTMANKQLPKYFSHPINKEYPVEEGLIVSFTSFPGRIDEVWKVVQSLKRQTLLPEKIFLWLSKDQFQRIEDIPENLRKEENDIFEIRMVDGDIRSHKKYYYVLLTYPDKTFITCDDDVIYDVNMIKRLVCTSKIHPGCIIANHTARIKFDEKGDISSYADFDRNVQPFSSDNLLQIGIGGCLYPPGSLHETVIEKDLFTKLSPLADDIWLNAMARLNSTPVVQTASDPLILPIVTDAPTLSSVNNGELNMNNVQIAQIRNYLKVNGIKDVYASTCDVRDE